MIKGNRIILRMYKSKEELVSKIDAFNNLTQRTLTDHTEIYSVNNILETFDKNGLWTLEEGTLLITNLENEIIGDISFKKTTDFELCIGYRIFNSENRGKGYATEALNLFSAYLFDTVPLVTRIALYTAEDNLPSRKLAQKCGFSQEGILRNAYFYRGKVCNWVIYSLLRDELN